MPKKYIAIDLGAESGRVMLGEITPGAEGKISLTEIHRFPNLQIRVPHLNGETLHWDILRLWHEIKTGLAKVAAEHAPDQIAGIAVDTWGVDFALLDKNGALVANPVCYRDARTSGMVEKVFARIPAERVYAITGIQTMALNTLFQLASLSFSSSPPLQTVKAGGGGGHIIFLPDLLTYWLSGHMSTDYTFASTSQMLDARTRTWSPEILAALGIDAYLFPPITMPGQRSSIRGPILASANEKLAAAQVPIISVGAHDTASAVAAVPANSGGGDWLYLSSGTWSLLGAEVDHPVLTEKAAHHNVTNEGGVGGNIRLLKNIAGLWLLQECRREWARQGTDLDYAALTDLAQHTPSTQTILDLNDPAFTTPGDMPSKITAHCHRTNQKAPSTPGEFTRVILESLARTYAQVKAILEEITGREKNAFKTLHIVGGGSQNHLLNQLAANSTRMRVLAGPVEATALGNILTQALSTGELDSLSAARALVRRSFDVRTFHPQ